MKIVVFGAGGRAGSAIVERGLDMGHEITAFARTPSKLAHLEAKPNLLVTQGDVEDSAAVEAVLVGQGAVISALGAGTLEPTTYLHDMSHNVVKAMEAHGPRRLVVLSHVGVLLKKVDPQYQHVAEEHRRNFAMLQASSLDWTAVCPPGIAGEPAHGHVETVAGKRAPNWTISRFDLADFMLEEASVSEFLHQAVGVSN